VSTKKVFNLNSKPWIGKNKGMTRIITNTSYTGSHKQHAPVNIMPKSGWAGVLLPTKLGGVDSGSVGCPNWGWLLTKVDKCTIPGPHATPQQRMQPS